MTTGGAARPGGKPARRRAGAGPARRRPSGWPAVDGAQDRFGLLLLILVAAYLLSAFLTGFWVSAVQLVLFLAVATLAVRAGRLERRTRRLAVAIAAGGSIIAVILATTNSGDVGAGAANLWAAAILLFAVGLIVRRILRHRAVTIQSIFGAVSAYMMIGLMFAALYSAMYRFGGETFFANGSPGNVKTFQYFSFTTLTTLGYGDFTAADNGGRAVAVIEALGGQVFLATLVARLVAAFRVPAEARRPTRRRGRAGRRGAGRARAGGRSASSGAPPRARRISSRARARQARRSRPRPER